MRKLTLAPLLAAALVALAAPRPGRAGEACYLLLFSSQRIPNDSNYSHTFATFVRAAWEGDGPPPAAPALQVCTISWLPAAGRIRSHTLLPERGRNYSLDETLRRVLAEGEHVSLWGPYEVEPEFYERAVRQAALLESGRVRYKANDGGRRSDRTCNCIHAIGAVANGNRLHWISPWWGEPAGWVTLLTMRPWVIDTCRVHYWVGAALGLDAYPLRWREGYAITTFTMLLEQIRTLLSGGRWPESTFGPPAP